MLHAVQSSRRSEKSRAARFCCRPVDPPRDDAHPTTRFGALFSTFARGEFAFATMVVSFVIVLLLGGARATKGDELPTRGEIRSSAEAPRGMVATVHPAATDAAVGVFRDGGNAVDAAVAAALTLGVVDGHNSGIGGGCFLLIRRGDGQVAAIDGRETAPAAAHRDMFIRDGKAETELSQTGPLAAGVPGALAAYDRAVREHGRLPLARLLKPGARLAEEGFALDPVYADKLSATAGKLRRFPETARVLLDDDARPHAAGWVLRQPDLARTYRSVAEHGVDWFYRGPFAQLVGSWMKEQGGVMTADDFAAYRAKSRTPLTTEYRGYTIIGFPPPSSGGVHVAQMLQMLERFELARMHRERPADAMHVTAETMKRAFADRAFWLGDPDFADVPRGLIDREYSAERSADIRLDRATSVRSHGQPPRAASAASDLFERSELDEPSEQKHTTHVAAADADGNWVAITATVNTTFGCKVIVPGTGVILNNQMDDFSIQPGVPNAFGLIGAEANSVAPGKRPLSSMSPTIVLKDGEPIMTVGAAGGPKIITQVLLALIRRLDFDEPLADAIGRPRFHHQWSPDELLVESGTPNDLVDALRRRGHQVKVSRSAGVSQAIEFDASRRLFIGVHDPRVPGKAAGY